ncbi:Putative Sld7 domain-containing protein [Septoria linicola]|uniref:Sld7 domain-containing protein n=1 Tax=Septoria linicola TaxID=215465 RepID=A0A9Q9AVS4_9PEZI|nr:putative Sld7 domain-containing protein [Septoria linicola]USW53008.1 Putative Sld7 domain-containing protein [Septoria linicola]
MISRWQGSIAINEKQNLAGISIFDEDREIGISAESTLRFISVVETSRIPLFVSVGKPYQVTSTSSESEGWLSSILLSGNNGRDDHSAWWQTAQTDSPLGVLIEVSRGSSESVSTVVITELLLYASRDSRTDALGLYALPLCSDLLNQDALNEPTPPPSPRAGNVEIEPTFLSLGIIAQVQKQEVINLPPVRKRKTVADTFDEATERRKHARKSGGVGIAAAASRTVSHETLPVLKHRRSISNNQGQLQSRPASKASSVSSVRQSATREVFAPAQVKRSSLARVQSAAAVSATDDGCSIDAKNKEMISKVVMAGMRLHGFAQSKTRKSRSNSTVESPALEATFDQLEIERKNDEEYKLVYHQIYKGTCFAFRQHIGIKSLAMHTDALRETVDKFLGIFCIDPLLSLGVVVDDEYTPGGRKLFGSATVPLVGNPFLVAPVAGAESKSNTPCGRKAAPKQDPT